VLAILLAALASASTPCATPEAWAACPVARSLHPVSWDYASHYRRSLETVMAGNRASPLFLTTVNEADVHWRLLAGSGRGLDLPRGRDQVWTDLALAGSFLVLDRMLSDVAERSEEVAAVRTAFDTMLSPSANFTFRPNGSVSVAHRTGGSVARRFDRSAEAQGFDEGATDDHLDAEDAPASPRAARAAAGPGAGANASGRPVKLQLDVGWTLRDLDAPASTPPLSWGAGISLRNAGLTLWRADVDLVTLRWNALARQLLFGKVSAGVSVNGAEGGAAPDRWTAGLYWNPRPRSVVTLQRSESLSSQGWRVDVDIRVLLGGQLVGTAAPAALRPNRLTSTTTSPADRP
jgi:hypothetical protein